MTGGGRWRSSKPSAGMHCLESEQRALYFNLQTQVASSCTGSAPQRALGWTCDGRGCRVQKPAQEIPWRLLLSKAPVWALIVCHFCHNWGTFILLTWMPTYYNQARRGIVAVPSTWRCRLANP